MESIRRGVFETNSSSTHSLTMCSESEYDKWKKGELFFDRWSDEFVEKEVVEKEIEKMKKDFEEEYKDREWEDDDEKQEYLEEYLNEDKQYYSYDEFWNEIEYETFVQKYKTKSGEIVIGFGYYGTDY